LVGSEDLIPIFYEDAPESEPPLTCPLLPLVFGGDKISSFFPPVTRGMRGDRNMRNFTLNWYKSSEKSEDLSPRYKHEGFSTDCCNQISGSTAYFRTSHPGFLRLKLKILPFIKTLATQQLLGLFAQRSCKVAIRSKSRFNPRD
jgi:hypothetical protein